MTFETAFDRVVKHEGGLSLDPNDRGNWTSGRIGDGELHGTKYGISAAAYPTLDIANVSLDDARAIYQRDFWTVVHAETMPSAVAFLVFDFAVNSGPQTAVRYLQRALRIADDGDWGPVSQAALRDTSASEVVMRYCAERLDYMTRLSGWPSQGRGWARRIAQNLTYAADDL